MWRLVILELKQWIAFFVIYFPETALGGWMRKKYWRYYLRGKLGPNCIIERGATIGRRELVSIGDYFMMGDSAAIAAGDSHPIWIGNHVAISRHAWVRTANHRFDDLSVPFMNQGHDFKEIGYKGGTYSIVIEDDVWVAANTVVLSGAHIGTGSIIGAGSVVSGFIPPYSVVIGNPGRIVKSRKPKEVGKENEVLRN